MDDKKEFIAKKMKILKKEGYSTPQSYAITMAYVDKKYAQQGFYNIETDLDEYGLNTKPIVLGDLKSIEQYQPYTGRGYGAQVIDPQKTIDTHDWYFDTEEKKKQFLDSVKKKGSNQIVKDFQVAYNEELKNRLGKSNLSEEQKSKIYNESAFTGYGVQSTDGKFGAFTSSRPMFNIDPNNPIKAEQTPQQIVSPAITNNTSPKLYNVNIIAEDMSDGTRDFQKGSLQAYIKDRTEKQGGLTEEDLQYVKRGIDLSNSEIEAKYNNEDSKNNKKAQERYKKLKQSLNIQEVQQQGGKYYAQQGIFPNFDMQNILNSQMMSPPQNFTSAPSLATPSYTNMYSPGNAHSWDTDNNKVPDLVQRPEENNVDTTKQNPVAEQTYNTRYNIANPYGGYSPELMAMKSGEFFGRGNTGIGIVAGAGSLLGFGRNFTTGLASGKENERVKNEYFDTLFSEKPNYVYQQGGDVKLTNAEFLTGQFVADEGQGNVNVEGGEYLQRQGNVQEVVGEPHIKNGKEHDGVNVNLNEGDRVLSDYTKIPAQTIKELKDRYKLSLKKGATFADAQKAFDKKLGIQKTTDELAEYIEKFGKNESTKDETTKRLNASVLAKEIEEYKGKLDELKQPQAMFFDKLFEVQESIPKRGNGTQLYDKNGKEVKTEQEVAQQGGQQEQMQALFQMVAQALQSGATPEQIAQELVNQGVPQEVVGQIIQEVANQLQGQQAPQEGQMEGQAPNQQEEEMIMAQQGFSFSTKYTPKVVGYDVEGNPILDVDRLENVERMQPYTGQGYGAKMTEAQKTIDLHKWYFDTEEKKKTFIEATKKEGSQPEIKAFQEAYNEEARKRAKSAGVPDSEIDGIIKEVGFTGDGVQQFDGKFGAFTSSRPLFNFSKKDGEVKVEVKESKPLPTNLEEKPIVPIDRTQTVAPWLPQALRLAPSSLDPLAKEQVNLQRIEPVKLTTEPMLAEQERQRQTDVARVQATGLTPQQQEALLAQGLSSSQLASNDAIGKVEMANQQNQFQADQFNIGQTAKEDITNAQYRQAYQNQVLGSLNAYERDLRNFYTQDYLDRNQKYKDIENINLLNAKTDNFQYIPGQPVQYLSNQSVSYATPNLNKVLEEMTAQERVEYGKALTSGISPQEALKISKAKQKYGAQ